MQIKLSFKELREWELYFYGIKLKPQQWCRRDEVAEIKCRTNLNNSLLHSYHGYLDRRTHENTFKDPNTALRIRMEGFGKLALNE